MRREGKQTAAMAKTKVLPFGSSKCEARGKRPAKQEANACSLFTTS